MLTANIRYVDVPAVTAAVERWARDVAGRPNVQRIVWYGSFVTGTPTPRSDADLFVVVDDASLANTPRAWRAPEYQPRLRTPVPFDISVLTPDEFTTLSDWAPQWARAITSGRVLFAR